MRRARTLCICAAAEAVTGGVHLVGSAQRSRWLKLSAQVAVA